MTLRVDQRGLARRAKLSVNDLSTGILTVAGGGTGVGSLTGVVIGNGTSVMTAINTSTALAAVMADETGTGALVFANTPQLVTPLLGTPSSGVATNLTGTANGLTAGSVVTNANLTGPIQSVGNLTNVASYPTTGKPAYAIGNMYFDTTLNKLRIGGGSTWETITSV